MDTVELQHWMHIAASRAAVAAVASIHDMMDKSKRRIIEAQRKFEVNPRRHLMLPHLHMDQAVGSSQAFSCEW